MKFDENKYKYYTAGNKVIAVSTYAGKTVKGVAKCDPKDISLSAFYQTRKGPSACDRIYAAKRRTGHAGESGMRVGNDGYQTQHGWIPFSC